MTQQLTHLLKRLQAGDSGALDALFAVAYPELERLARARLRGGGRNTVLNTSALVHESYLQFVKMGELRAEDRRAFFAYASQVMRSIIVGAARNRLAGKRGGDWERITLADQSVDGRVSDEEAILNMHEALAVLEAANPRLAQVAQMRYFGGYSEKEIAAALDITERTVQRDWEKARIALAAVLR
jgi:RNA polymerase sigma factor (TIGR02999 family)